MCLLLYGDCQQTIAPCNWIELVDAEDPRIYQFAKPIFIGQQFEFFCEGELVANYFKNVFGQIVPVYNDMLIQGSMIWHKIVASQSKKASYGHVLFEVQVDDPNNVPELVDRYWIGARYVSKDDWLMEAALQTKDIGYIELAQYD